MPATHGNSGQEIIGVCAAFEPGDLRQGALELLVRASIVGRGKETSTTREGLLCSSQGGPWVSCEATHGFIIGGVRFLSMSCLRESARQQQLGRSAIESVVESSRFPQVGDSRTDRILLTKQGKPKQSCATPFMGSHPVSERALLTCYANDLPKLPRGVSVARPAIGEFVNQACFEQKGFGNS